MEEGGQQRPRNLLFPEDRQRKSPAWSHTRDDNVLSWTYLPGPWRPGNIRSHGGLERRHKWDDPSLWGARLLSGILFSRVLFRCLSAPINGKNK